MSQALALNFIAFDRSLAEQHRVLRPGGGTIAAYGWDYAGEYDYLRRLIIARGRQPFAVRAPGHTPNTLLRIAAPQIDEFLTV